MPLTYSNESNEVTQLSILPKEDLQGSLTLQDGLDIKNRVRTNLFPWTGQFSPQLVEELLTTFGHQVEHLLDPFVGSGTSLIEAARLGHEAWGSDLNPAAVIMAKTYELVNVGVQERERAIEEVEDELHGLLNRYDGPLFQATERNSLAQTSRQGLLLELQANVSSNIGRMLLSTLIVLCDLKQSDIPSETIKREWSRLSDIVLSLPLSDKPIVARLADARALPLPQNSADMVITSPPYINVHNYHQQFRKSVEAIGWNVLELAPSEIGSNRQNRGNRFLTVIQYSLDMALALQEMTRITKPSGSLILVVGRESNVRGVAFRNGSLVASLAGEVLELESDPPLEREFINRFGKRIREDILRFQSTDDFPDGESCLSDARKIAIKFLDQARHVATGDRLCDLEDALARSEIVQPSPLVTSSGLS